MNPYELIKLNEDSFTKSELIIKDYILDNPQIIIKYNIITASAGMDVSKSALLRFCKKLGYNGFSDFKYDLSRYVHSGGTQHFSEEDAILQVTSIMSGAINKLTTFANSKQLEELASLICQATNIRIFGQQSTGTSCTQLMFRLLKLGIVSYAYNDIYSYLDIDELAKPTDLHIIFSMSASGISLLRQDDGKYNFIANSVLITQNTKSSLKETVDHIVLLPNLEKDDNDYFIESQFLNFAFIELLIVEVSKHIEKQLSTKTFI